jgi:hypothetical protein
VLFRSRGQAVVNGLELKAMLTGRRSNAPRQLVSTYTRSGGLLRPDVGPGAGIGTSPRGQLELFDDDDEHEDHDDADEDR